MVKLARLLGVTTFTAEIVLTDPWAAGGSVCALTGLTLFLTLSFTLGVNATCAVVLVWATFPFVAPAAFESVADTFLFSDHGHSCPTMAPRPLCLRPVLSLSLQVLAYAV